jgi:hypothetical protein
MAARLGETGTWFITSTQFAEWKANADSFIWVYGRRKCYDRVVNLKWLLTGLHSWVWQDHLNVSSLHAMRACN